MTRGGPRKGAGRPATKGVTVQIKITPAQKEWLVAKAEESELTLTEVIVVALAEQGMPV